MNNFISTMMHDALFSRLSHASEECAGELSLLFKGGDVPRHLRVRVDLALRKWERAHKALANASKED